MDASHLIHILLGIALFGLCTIAPSRSFPIREATVDDLQVAFKQNKLTSKQLVEFYLREIRRLNPVLRGVIEVNPNALDLADKADRERKLAKSPTGSLSKLHGIPILVKDNIATKDKLNTTAGSYALLGSTVPRDAGVVQKLRKAGAIILGKASLSEWSYFRSTQAPNGWSARGGQVVNPYAPRSDPCGSSTGSAVSVAANMAAVSLGTETAGSILCPSSNNSVVGIKPTVGLTSRAGVIPISPRQDTVGPICRTVSDAVHVLDAIVGFDHNDGVATRIAAKYIPPGGYAQFLKVDGLRGKRLGITAYPFFGFPKDTSPSLSQAFKRHFLTLRQKGAILVDHLEIDNYNSIIYALRVDQFMVLEAEFKLSMNAYLKQLVTSPVHSLADLIAFNKRFPRLEKLKEYGQNLFLGAQKMDGLGSEFVMKALLNLTRANKDGFEKLMKKNNLDALVTPLYDAAYVLAIGGFPGISVPAGYDTDGVPFGICFAGLKGSEPKLIEIAYGFEQATRIRKPPSITFI
ncbi:probable amidase At4g34880 isoform X1 [Malania oleifera]|uniref:probable amidase At4g34880 isoform X1 n=1 Tax=Malania oleifera TaxID=397392 RepID=UPI0025AE5A86|nr:probable amidase At4g34880 isoform X1 [Malania oleifera]